MPELKAEDENEDENEDEEDTPSVYSQFDQSDFLDALLDGLDGSEQVERLEALVEECLDHPKISWDLKDEILAVIADRYDIPYRKTP